MTREGSSQPSKWFKHKATRSKLDQNLTDDEINLIALKFGMEKNDALMDFQKNQKQYVKEMEEQIAKLRDAVTQLRKEPMAIGPQLEQQSKQTKDPVINVVHFNPSQRTVSLNAAAIGHINEVNNTEGRVIRCLDKLSLIELYQLQQETQFELRDR